MTKRGTSTRRSAAAVGAIALVVVLAGCDVTLDGQHSTVEITRTCRGESGHFGTSRIRTQVLVTLDADETEDYDIDISLNDGAQTSSSEDHSPGDGVALLDNQVNTVEIDVTVAPSDGTGNGDTFHQIFNPCR